MFRAFRQLPSVRCSVAFRCSLKVQARLCSSAGVRPPKSKFLHDRPDLTASSEEQPPQQQQQQQQQQPQRYGPLEVDLQPRDQLRPLLPTWNPPPTRKPRPDELEVSTRLRFLKEDRWWAATVREVLENDEVKVGYDGWPSRHDEVVTRDSDRLYLHESFHEDYVAPPLPQRYQRPTATDSEGNPLPAGPRVPRPKVYDPEKERMKRALRPPLPYNPEKERLKRLLRGQYVPPVESLESPIQRAEPESAQKEPAEQEGVPRQAGTPDMSAFAQNQVGASSHLGQVSPASPQSSSKPAAPAPPPLPVVEWAEVPGGMQGARAFRHATTGEVRQGPPPTQGWVELMAEGGSRYYWHVGRNVTQWEQPQ
eukprot:TRINITY_DN374_c1_g1_i1.p1 TRINITY_DN374_c1_g1~~TRINITY_DN374_c1_g1_i1.p1  ORF type:complete len:366 (+),score=79.17 TRINITY_DN374_c1_g1_i1:37-1134(+)